MFIGRTNAEAEPPILWPTDAKNLEKTVMLRKIEGRRIRRPQRMKWLGGLTNSVGISFSSPQELVMGREAWHSASHNVAKSQTRLSN